ncbi:MAG: hypothetical protein MJY45_01715 [Bacteroidales bacterium]|nr:hypothetical protein [Bacteroidales bacterium]
MKYEIEDREGKHCLECGTSITYGRQDKKFCCSKCRNDYYNRRSHDHRIIEQRINAALNRNYSILKKLLDDGVTSATLSDLSEWGFRPESITGHGKVGRHDQYRCYEIRYFQSVNKIFGITFSPIRNTAPCSLTREREQ